MKRGIKKMNSKNFTQRSIFIKNPQKINQEINRIIEFAVESFEESKLYVNLYISGSLARQEPTVKIINKEEKLNSDLDFVLIHKENTEKQKEIFDIVEKIKKQYKDYDCSFVLLCQDQLPKVNSLFARDLKLGMKNPIYKSFEEQQKIRVEITEKNYFESLITQMCCYLLNPDFTMSKNENKYFKNSDYHYMKLTMECIRAIHYNAPNVLGYNTLFGLRCKTLNEKENNSCIKARELSNRTYMPDIDINILLDEAFTVLFHEKNYIHLIVNELVSSDTSDIILFQYAMLLFWKGLSEDRYLHDTFYIFKKVEFVEPFIDEINDNFTSYLSDKSTFAKEKVILCIRKIRNLYVELLHRQNTGELLFVDKILKNNIE